MHGGRASKGTRQEERKQGEHPIQRTASGVGFQFFQHVLGVNARGDESRTFLCHGSQELQPTLVDARDLTEIDSARSSVLRSVPIFPARPQLADPRSDQAAFESPPLFCSRLGDRNSQHSRGSLSSASGDGSSSAGHFDHSLQALPRPSLHERDLVRERLRIWTSDPPRSKCTSSMYAFISMMPRPHSTARSDVGPLPTVFSHSNPLP
jgi:hypothetical protein